MIKYYENLSLENIVYLCPIDEILKTEEWRDIPNYVGSYQSSNLGRIKSLERHVKHPKKGFKILHERILKQGLYGRKYLSCGLSVNGKVGTKDIHVLIGMTFLGHTNENRKIVVDHIKPKEKTNNCVWNLQIITQRENSSKDKSPKTNVYGVVKTKHSSYSAQITLGGRSILLGTFKDIDSAKRLHTKALCLVNSGCSISDLIAIKESKPKKIGITNVLLCKNGKYRVRIKHEGKMLQVGTFSSKEIAESSYQQALIDIKNNCFKCLTDTTCKNSSKEPNIYIEDNKFKVILTKNKIRKNVGRFDSIEKAIEARDLAILNF
jgi:hypothetical protein